MTNEQLYKMDLHDEIELWAGLYILRVSGGWIYRPDMEQVGGHWMSSSIFVPLNSEFEGS